jgi:hypothetical protein
MYVCNTIFKHKLVFLIAIGRPDIVQISTEEQSSPIVLSGFPDTLLMPQTKLVQNIDVTTGTCNNLY